jgi:hypothetical protein
MQIFRSLISRIFGLAAAVCFLTGHTDRAVIFLLVAILYALWENTEAQKEKQ